MRWLDGITGSWLDGITSLMDMSLDMSLEVSDGEKPGMLQSMGLQSWTRLTD